MNRRQHAALARELIRACGGLAEATSACRLRRSRLAECQDAFSTAYLPIDVVNQLELYCGRALYSGALADDRPTASNPVDDLADAACETAEEAVDLQRLTRLLERRSRGRLSPRELSEVLAEAMKVREALGGLIAAADRGDGR